VYRYYDGFILQIFQIIANTNKFSRTAIIYFHKSYFILLEEKWQTLFTVSQLLTLVEIIHSTKRNMKN